MILASMLMDNMLIAQLLAIHPYVFVPLDIKEIHFQVVIYCLNAFLNLIHHVSLLLAGQMLFVRNITRLDHVPAYQIILETRMMFVVLNVQLIRIVHQIKVVFETNVMIRARVPARRWQHV